MCLLNCRRFGVCWPQPFVLIFEILEFGSLTLSAAYKTSDGSLRLLQYLAAHESETKPMSLRRWVLTLWLAKPRHVEI